jgi:4-hydroxybenzoyl-CoA thioesterase/acyl-CoA thioester hydrolase
VRLPDGGWLATIGTMQPIYKTTRRVEFHDTDAAGIMHFSTFFTFMEEAEHELLRHLGLSVYIQEEGETISWPRVSAACDFTDTVRFEDEVEIGVQIERLGDRSVTYGFHFQHDQREIAKGAMTSVCCRISEDNPPESIVIPEWIAEKLRAMIDA